MKKNSTKSKKVLAILLSLAFVLSMTPALSVFGADNTLNVNKTVNWGVGNGGKTDYTKLSISVTSQLPDATSEYPDILFLGCNCDYHGLTSDTVNSSLNKCLYRGNVDFYIFSNNSIKKSGSLTKGSALGTNAIQSTDMSNRTHSCLSGFMDTLYTSLNLANGGKNNKYDYIVLEFDSARLAADYSKNTHESAIADALKWYYDNGRVIWITDSETYNFYSNAPSKNYIYGKQEGGEHKTLSQEQMKGMAAVISPSQYASVTSSTSTLSSIPQNHKGTYTNADTVFSAIKTVIYTRLSATVVDKIKTISTDAKILSVEAFFSDDEGTPSSTSWTAATAVPTIGEDGRTVTFEEEDLDVAHKWVKLNISVQDPKKFISIAEETSKGSGIYSINPNDGNATVTARALSTGTDGRLIQTEYTGNASADTNCHYYEVSTKVTNGTITETKKYGDGETAVVEYSPKDGYKLKSVTVDGVSKDIETYPSSYTFTDIADKHSVEVEYELKIFNITYSGLEGASLGEGKTNPATYTQDDAFTLNNPSKQGYVFAGWTGTGLSKATTTVKVAKGSSGDRAYVATWNPATNTKYTVKHYKQNLDGTYNDGTGGKEDKPDATDNKTGTTDSDTAAAAKSTTSTSDDFYGFTAGTVTQQKIAPDGSTVLKIYYSRNSYDVEYVYDASAPSSASTLPDKETKKYGESVSVAGDASATGYDFNGWTTTDAVVGADKKFTMPNKKVTITGSFTEHTATLTYDANGGVPTTVPAAQTMYYSKAAYVNNTTIPTREGYVFKGWNTDKDAKTVNYAGGSTFKAANVEPEDDTLYAVWEYGQVLTKTVDVTDATSGDVLTFTITITNKSKDTFTNYTVEDTLSDNLVFESAEYGTTTIGKDDTQIQGQKLTLTGLTIPAKSGDNDGVLIIVVKAKVKDDLAEETSIKNTSTGTDDNGVTIEGSTPDIPLYPAWIVTYQYDSTNHEVPVNAVLPIDDKKYSDSSTETKTATVKTQTAVPGWEFSGWYTDKDFKDEHKAGTTVVLSGHKTLYGYWTNKITPSKTVDKTTVVGGEELTYSIKVKNNSSQDVTGYTITDVLEDRLIYKTSALTTNAETGSPGNTPTYNTTNKTVTATNVSIPAGKTVTLVITVTVDPYLTAATTVNALTNQAKVNANTGDKERTVDAPSVTPTPKPVTVNYEYRKANESDPLPAGLEAPASVTSKKYGDTLTTAARQTAQGWNFDGWYYYDASGAKVVLDDGADLVLKKENIQSLATTDTVTLYGTWSYAVTLTKTVNKTSAMGGDDIEYTITASNGSSNEVTGYKITDALDSRLTYKAGTLSSTKAGDVDGSVSADGQNVTASGLTIPANGSVTLKITATVTSALTEDTAKDKVQNTATGTPSKADPPKTADSPEVSLSPRGISVVYHYVNTALDHTPDGATVPNESTTFAYGSDYIIKSKSGSNLTHDSWYTFSGWYKNYNEETGEFTGLVEGTKALTTDEFGALTSGNQIDLYGTWTAIDSYTVSKDAFHNSESVKDGEVLANNVVTYNVTVVNDSPAESRNISLVDELPAGLTVVDDSITESGVLNEAETKITWELTLGPSQTKVLSFGVLVPEDLENPTEYTNTAYVDKVEGKPYDGPGSETPEKPTDKGPGTVKFTGIPITKIAVKKTWSDGWEGHEAVTVGLYKNEGTVATKTFELSDETVHNEILPAFEKAILGGYNAVEYSFKEIIGGSAADEGTVKSLTIGEKSAKYMVNYTDATIEGGIKVTTISNTYQLAPSDLEVGKSAFRLVDEETEESVEKVEKDDTYSYKLTVKNTRTDVGASDVVVEDEVPAGLTIGTITAAEGDTVVVTGQTVTWTVGSLEKDGTATLTIPVTVSSDSDIAEMTNVARVIEIGATPVPEIEKPSSDEVKTKIRNFTASKAWYSYDKEKKTVSETPMTLDEAAEMPAVSVKLMRSSNGGEFEQCSDTVTLNADNAWEHKWTKLDLYDAEGHLYAYTVVENEVAGYSTSVVAGEPIDFKEESVTTGATVKNIQGTCAVSYAFATEGGHPTGVNTPPSETVAYGEAYTAAEKLSAPGYTFEGWFTDPECTELFIDGSKITEDTVLYGKWTPTVYTISYELDGGEVVDGTNPTTYTADDDDITLINPVRENYKFVGWTGTDLSTETLTVVIPHGSIGDRAYKAVWQPLNHDIHYDKPKDGPYNPENPQYTEPTTETYPRFTKLIVDPNAGVWIHDGVMYTIPAEFILTQDIVVERPTRDKFIFLGWDRIILDEGATIKLVARWTPDEIGTTEDEPDKSDNIPDIYQKKVIFKIQHGEWEDATVEDIVVVVNLVNEAGELDPNGSATITIPEGMRPATGFSPENGEWDNQPTIVVTGTDELVYLYSYKPEYVFRPVDGDEDDTETVKVEIGQKIRVNPNGGKWKHLGRTYWKTTTIVIEENTKIADATRKGYQFLGWSTSIDKDGIVTLTAQWKSLGAKTGDSNGNDLNNYLFTGMFALIAAALVMIWRKRGGMGSDDGAGMKLQLESVGARLENMMNEGFEKAKAGITERVRNFKKPTRTSAPKTRTVPQKIAKPEPIKIVHKENKSYMGWYDTKDDYRIIEEEPVVEQKVEVEPELPDVIKGAEFIIKVKK